MVTLVLWIVAVWVVLLVLAVLSVSRFTALVRAKQRRADAGARRSKSQKGWDEKLVRREQDPPAA